MRKITQTDREQSVVVFAAYHNIIAAWIFGSAQKGLLADGSDLDLAVLFETKPNLDELAALRADLQQALQIEAIDLVALNDASPVLRFEAISGLAIYVKDVGERAAFASLTAREYEDEVTFALRALAAGNT